jgi:hypothetical protein
MRYSDEAVTADDPGRPFHRLVLITGAPGTGKRSVGSFLAAEHGFRHLNLAGLPERRSELDLLLTAREAEGEDIVVTCTEACPTELLELLCSAGVEWFWFDGDRGATRPRGAAAEPRFVDPFEPNGSFRPVSAVAAELLSSAGRGPAGGSLPATGRAALLP